MKHILLEVILFVLFPYLLCHHQLLLCLNKILR
ncbi:putative membrane protein [Neisseria meningitidis 63023]|nr:putative membrane protein [Neisseria meningitidis 63023]